MIAIICEFFLQIIKSFNSAFPVPNDDVGSTSSAGSSDKAADPSDKAADPFKVPNKKPKISTQTKILSKTNSNQVKNESARK